MSKQYFYRVAQGKATLNKGDDDKPKAIGTFKTDTEAKEACEKHFAKVCAMMSNIGKELPTKFYI